MDGPTRVARVEHLLDEIEKDIEDIGKLEGRNESGQKPWNSASRKLGKVREALKELDTQSRKKLITIDSVQLDLLFERNSSLTQKHGSYFYEKEDRNDVLARREKLKAGSSYDPEQGLTEDQQDQIEDQNETLSNLSQSIGRQKKVGMQIFDEIDAQNQLLDDLDEGMFATSNRIDSSTGRIKRLMEDNSTKIGIGAVLLIVLLLTLIIVLAI